VSTAKSLRINRLFEIVMLVQSSPAMNPAALADACGVQRRTVFRDLEVLQEAGVPIFFDEATRGYQIRRDFFLPPVQLTFDEAVALCSLVQHMAEDGQLPMLEPAARAIRKVRTGLPPVLQDTLARLDDRVHVQLAANMGSEGIEQVYKRVQQAITSRRQLQCRYDSVHPSKAGEVEAAGDGEFLFAPYSLFYNQRAWYAIGRRSDRDELRTLKLNRFTRVTPTDRPYMIPDDFSLPSYLGNAWRMVRGDGVTYDVELHFDAEFAENIADTQWHPTQQIEHLDNGDIRFTCQVDGLDEIIWWILSMGPHCKVIQPQRLVERVRREAEKMVQLYGPR